MLLYNKGNYKHDEKTAFRMGEIVCNWDADKRLISKTRIAHEVQYKKKIQPNQKWAEDLNRHSSKVDIQIDNKHRKKCSTSLINRKMKIKTPVVYHRTLVRMAIIKISTNSRYWRRTWQPTPMFSPGESQGWGSLVGCRLWGRRVGLDWSDLAAAADTGRRECKLI